MFKHPTAHYKGIGYFKATCIGDTIPYQLHNYRVGRAQSFNYSDQMFSVHSVARFIVGCHFDMINVYIQ